MLDPFSAALIAGGTMGAAAIGRGGGGGVSQQSTLTPGQRKLLEQMTGSLGQQWGQGLTPYGGQRVAPFSPLQQQSFDMMGGMGSMFGPAQDITQQALGQYSPAQGQRAQQLGMGGLEQMMQPFDPSRISQAMKPVGDYAMSQYKEELVPWLAEKYGPALGAKSSGAFGRELAKGGERLGMGLASQFAPYQMQGFENQMNRMAQGVPMSQQMAMGPMNMLNQTLGGVGQFPFQMAQGMMGAGGVQQAQSQAELGAGQQYWQEAQPWQNPWLNFLGPALGKQGVENVYKQGGPGMGAMMAPMLGSMLGSQWFGNMINPGQTTGQAMNALANPWAYG